MGITIAAMPAYHEIHTIAEVIKGCKKYVDKVVVVDGWSNDIAEFPGVHGLG